MRSLVIGLVVTFFALLGASANATTLNIVDTSAAGISFIELEDPSDGSVSGFFSGDGNGTGSFTIDASAATPASVFAIAFEAFSDPEVQALVTLGDTTFTLNAGEVQLSIPAALMLGTDNVFSVEISGASSANWGLQTTVAAVPLPAAAWLFISAVVGLLVARRRQPASV